mmetsp:Transcript_62571/g.102536  ORF Transcript_62571/g.102536 Transcript_62571/m.102536 type:complete len:299 (+) Transcript_62571:39-935(+)
MQPLHKNLLQTLSRQQFQSFQITSGPLTCLPCSFLRASPVQIFQRTHSEGQKGPKSSNASDSFLLLPFRSLFSGALLRGLLAFHDLLRAGRGAPAGLHLLARLLLLHGIFHDLCHLLVGRDGIHLFVLLQAGDDLVGRWFVVTVEDLHQIVVQVFDVDLPVVGIGPERGHLPGLEGCLIVVVGLLLKHITDLFAHVGVVTPIHALVIRSPERLSILSVHQQHQPIFHLLQEVLRFLIRHEITTWQVEHGNVLQFIVRFSVDQGASLIIHHGGFDLLQEVATPQLLGHAFHEGLRGQLQ